MSNPHLALRNLRAFVILIVLAFHSVLAYLSFLPPAPFAFDDPPYQWRSFPMVDTQRWFGFDLFCAHQDLYLISLMFFLSGLFVWPSLARKGVGSFLYDRILRLGLPFAFAVGVLMPLAHYPIYRVTAVDPSVAAYWEHWLGLPFWPSGPPWFLWVLLVLDIAAVLVFRFAPGAGDAFARLNAHPKRIVGGLLACSAAAYVPLALAFGPWDWGELGPFAFQLCRPLHYAVYFFAGVGIGACGMERGLLAADGILVRRWRTWLLAGIASYVGWLGFAGLATAGIGPVPLVQTLQAIGFVLGCGVNCMLALALAMRFANRPLPKLDFLSDNAYGLYLVHYVFVVWLQYLLLGAALIAILKAMLVFAGTLVLSSAVLAAVGRLPAAGRIIGTARTVAQKTN